MSKLSNKTILLATLEAFLIMALSAAIAVVIINGNKDKQRFMIFNASGTLPAIKIIIDDTTGRNEQ